MQVVFDHVQSVLAANGWVPAVLHQANVASDLALSKITVVRAIQALKTAGAIVVHNHGRWSTYALGNGQPQPVVSSISADVTSAMSAHFEPASSPENDVISANNDVTSAMSAHFKPASSPENDVISANNDVTSAMSAHFKPASSPENDVTSTPGPGLILLSSKLLKYPDPGARQLGKNDVTSLNTGDGGISASIAWVDTAQVLRQQMPPPQFEEFLAPCAGHSWAGDTLTVAAASAFAVQWLELTLHQDMADQALSTVVGSECSVAYRIPPSP